MKLKLSSFVIHQRSRTVGHGVCSQVALEQVAKELLSSLVKELLSDKTTVISARLLGVRVHNWVSDNGQSSLLSYTGPGKRWECPVCGGAFPAQIRSFNEHVDACVSKSVVDEPFSGESTALGGGPYSADVPSVQDHIVLKESLCNSQDSEIAAYSRAESYLETHDPKQRGLKRKSSETTEYSTSKRAPQATGRRGPLEMTSSFSLNRALDTLVVSICHFIDVRFILTVFSVLFLCLFKLSRTF